MKNDITYTIADLVRQNFLDLDLRLEAQAESLAESGCVSPVIGQWIDAYDVKYLLSALSLGEDAFAERFPGMAHIHEPERLQIVDAIESHFERCPHCSLKRGYDFELDARIKKTCLDNKKFLLDLMGNDEPSTTGNEDSADDDHLTLTASNIGG